MPQHAPHTSTLAATESAWRMPVTIATFISTALVAVSLAYSFPQVRLLDWLARAVPALALTLSNLHYLRAHPQPTVGMVPVALFALLPAARLVVLCRVAPAPVRAACQAATWLIIPLLALFAWWFCRLLLACRTRQAIASDAALVVLGGAVRKGRPCRTLALRLDVAARLWHDDPRRLIVVTGGPTPDRRTTEADAMARYLREREVDPGSIILERRARNTQENIGRSLALLDERGIAAERCVVSSDYHLWRALREARRLGTSLTPVPAPTPAASVPQQWCREVLTILFGR